MTNTNKDFVSINERVDNVDFVILSEKKDDKIIVDGKYILARVKGPAFFPNTTSRNGITYTLQTWLNVENNTDVRTRLVKRIIFGTIGHEIDSLNDEEIRKGNASHVVSDLYIEDDEDGNPIGYAEYLILNTPTGVILNNLLRAGCKLSVSTKCRGKLLQTTQSLNSKTITVKTVDANAFEFDRIDFVINPGYLDAVPEIKESLNKIQLAENHIKTDKGSNIMDKTELQVLAESIKSLVDDKSSKGSAEQIKTLFENFTLKHDNSVKLEAENSKLNESLQKTIAANKDLSQDLLEWQQVGLNAEDVTAKLEKLSTLEEDYNKQKEVITLKENLAKTAEEERVKISESLKTYTDLGYSPEQITNLIANSQKLCEKFEKSRIAGLSKKLNVDESYVSKLSSLGMSSKDISEFIQGARGKESVNESKTTKSTVTTTTFKEAKNGEKSPPKRVKLNEHLEDALSENPFLASLVG